MGELEYALETIDGGTFEDLAMDFLRHKGYDVHESGSTGRDGGWDARIQLSDRTGIAHVSTRSDWRYKLNQDAKKVKKLEDDRGVNYDLFVFVTNKEVTGQQELDIEDEIYEEFRWKLQIIHRDNLLGELRQNLPKLAKRYLDVDLTTDHDHHRRIEQLRDERVETIQNRNEHATNLPAGSVVALHIIPNSLFAQEKQSITNFPDPPSFGATLSGSPETRGQEKIRLGDRLGDNQYASYSLLRNDGLYEAVDWWRVAENDHDGCKIARINATVDVSDEGLDASIVITVKNVTSVLRDAGFSGVVFVSSSIIGASNAKLSTSKSRNDSLWSPPELGREVYSSELYPVPIHKNELMEHIEPLLSEIWREFGYEKGTENIEEGIWVGGSVSINRETLLEKGEQ